MNNKSPLVSIIIVNLNGEAFLYDNLHSIFSQREDETSLEVIIVDNASTDKSLKIIETNFPLVKVIRNSANLGFARGNNQGIEASRGAFILTLNNDTVLQDGFLQEIIGAALSSVDDIGMWAPKILSMEEPHLIDSAGGLLIYGNGLAKGRGRLEKDLGQYDGEKEVFIPSACAALYRKAMLDEVGGFDEDFFAYCEDTDLGLRARLAGWRAGYVPEAIVFHHYSGTSGRYTPFKAFLAERNHLWVAIKNFPLPMLALAPLYELWRYVIEVYGLVSGRGAGARFSDDFSSLSLLRILVKAYIDAARGLPHMLERRREIQKKTRARKDEVKAWFKKYGLRASTLVLRG